MCVTERLTFRNEKWISIENQWRKKVNGEIELFYYLSSSIPIKSSEFPNETFLRNASCHRNSTLSNDLIGNYLYVVWPQAECYDLVVSYEK
ncbi:hypothetical protein I4U23_016597 [Adineta vaga]|nr:hypothetical protein I4U23_016597 [Adineta vaga]